MLVGFDNADDDNRAQSENDDLVLRCADLGTN